MADMWNDDDVYMLISMYEDCQEFVGPDKLRLQEQDTQTFGTGNCYCVGQAWYVCH